MVNRCARAFFAIFSIACLTASAAFGAAAPSPTAAMMAPIRRLVSFVNTGAHIPAGTYASGAAITDDFAPFHWTTGDVGSEWSATFPSSNAAAKITNPHIVLGGATEFVTSPTRAFVVLPGTFTPLVNGKPSTETGYWTFVLLKNGERWQVLSQAWAGATFK